MYENERVKLYGLMGDLPERDRAITVTTLSVAEQDGYLLETLLLDFNGIEHVPAYFVKPLDTEGPLPCVLYNHAHGGDYVLGKTELIAGRGGLQNPPYARLLTAMGCAALCIDSWCFGERRGRKESATFKEMLWRGQVMWGMMVYDSLRALDYLMTRPDVDGERIATLGISMGSTMAWWLAALDTRIKVCIDLCCLTDFQALIDARNVDNHSVYYYVPGLMKHFTAAQINALIAPRPHLSVAGDLDPLTPPAGLDRIDQELRAAYETLGNPSGWVLKRYAVGHYETAAMRAEIVQFLIDNLL